MEEKKKSHWFSRRVSLATLSGCTQSKPAASGMIYLVKRDSRSLLTKEASKSMGLIKVALLHCDVCCHRR